jgi:hypothetical protein
MHPFKEPYPSIRTSFEADLDLRCFAAHFALFAWEPYQIRYCPKQTRQTALANHPNLQGEKLKTQVYRQYSPKVDKASSREIISQQFRK